MKNTLKKLTAKPNYDRSTIFDENLIAGHMRRIKIVYNKPIYLGMIILDISNVCIFITITLRKNTQMKLN